MELLTGIGPPSNRTPGKPGQCYKDLNTDDIYRCYQVIDVNTPHFDRAAEYRWKLHIKGDEQADLAETDETKRSFVKNKDSFVGSSESSGITYIENMDSNNPTILRDLDSGSYVLYGKFKPYTGSSSNLSFSSKLNVSIVKSSSYSSVMVFYPVDAQVQYMKITDDSYERTNISLLDLYNSINSTTETA